MTFKINLRQWKQSQNNCFVVKTSLCSFKWLSFYVFLIIILSICSYHSFNSHIHYSNSYGRIVLWQQYANEIFESNLAWLMYWIKWLQMRQKRNPKSSQSEVHWIPTSLHILYFKRRRKWLECVVERCRCYRGVFTWVKPQISYQNWVFHLASKTNWKWI